MQILWLGVVFPGFPIVVPILFTPKYPPPLPGDITEKSKKRKEERVSNQTWDIVVMVMNDKEVSPIKRKFNFPGSKSTNFQRNHHPILTLEGTSLKKLHKGIMGEVS